MSLFCLNTCLIILLGIKIPSWKWLFFKSLKAFSVFWFPELLRENLKPFWFAVIQLGCFLPSVFTNMQHLPFFFFFYSGLNFTTVCLNLCLSIFLCDTLGTEWALYLGSLGGAGGKEPTCRAGRCKRSGFHPWVGKIPLEEGHGTHSRILSWRIPWIEEPDSLQSIGTHRVGHDWSDLAHRKIHVQFWEIFLESSY